MPSVWTRGKVAGRRGRRRADCAGGVWHSGRRGFCSIRRCRVVGGDAGSRCGPEYGFAGGRGSGRGRCGHWWSELGGEQRVLAGRVGEGVWLGGLGVRERKPFVACECGNRCRDEGTGRLVALVAGRQANGDGAEGSGLGGRACGGKVFAVFSGRSGDDRALQRPDRSGVDSLSSGSAGRDRVLEPQRWSERAPGAADRVRRRR